MDFERQKPVTDEYRENFDKVFLFNERAAIIQFCGNVSRVDAEISAAKELGFYSNGCPILNEDANA